MRDLFGFFWILDVSVFVKIYKKYPQIVSRHCIYEGLLAAMELDLKDDTFWYGNTLKREYSKLGIRHKKENTCSYGTTIGYPLGSSTLGSWGLYHRRQVSQFLDETSFFKLLKQNIFWTNFLTKLFLLLAGYWEAVADGSPIISGKGSRCPIYKLAYPIPLTL